MRPQDIISDEEVARVHGNANFGGMSPREVVNAGVRKYAHGYSSGHTMMCILLEHGLIRKPKPGKYASTLTAKGFRYARSIYVRSEDLDEAASMLRSCIAMIQHAIGPGNNVFIEPDTGRTLEDARATLRNIEGGA